MDAFELFAFFQTWAVQNVYVLLFLAGASTLLFLVLVAVIFVLLKWLQWEVDNSGIFFYKYNAETERVLHKYRDWKVKRVVVVRQPFRRVLHWCLDLVTLFEYRKHFNHDTEPFHTALMVELTPPSAPPRLTSLASPAFVWIDKNNSVCVREKMHCSPDFDYLEVPVASKRLRKWTLEKWMEKTRHRIGDHAFFNWSLTQSNCQCFTKDLLETVRAFSPEMKEFVYRDVLLAKVAPSEFTLFAVHCANHLLNAVEKMMEWVWDGR